jgi:hypothetical protein
MKRTNQLLSAAIVLLAAALALPSACVSEVEPEGQGSDVSPVPCESAKDGDPCATPGETCGAIECYGCLSYCQMDAWAVTCSEQPACPSAPVAQASLCDSFCGPYSCGPYTVETPCGPETVTAECSPFGWAYPLECKVDCASVPDANSCDATLGCAWVVPCTTSPVLTIGCYPFPFEISTCEYADCDLGETCVEVYVNPDDLRTSDCSGSAAIAAMCLPAP